MANLVCMLIVVFAIHSLSQKRINYRVIALFHIILSLAVCWQFIAYYLFKMPYGTFIRLNHKCGQTKPEQKNSSSVKMFNHYKDRDF